MNHNDNYQNNRICLSAGVITFAANGIFAQIAQILLMRELLVVLEGDELALGMMLASWLIWVGIGACASPLLIRIIQIYLLPKVNKSCDDTNIHMIFYTTVLSISVVTLPVVIICIRLARYIFSTPLGTSLPFLDSVLLSTIAPAITCLGIGAMFPLSVYLTGFRPGKAFGLEGFGAITGGLFFTFVLVSQLAVITISVAAGTLCAFACMYLIIILAGFRFRRVILPGTISATGIAVIIFAGGTLDNYVTRLKWHNLLPAYTLVETVESPYGRYTLLKSSGQYSLFLDGHLVEDIPEPLSGTLLVHTVLLQHADPRDILVLGYGLAGTIRELAGYKPDSIDYVELDRSHYDILHNNLPYNMIEGLHLSASSRYFSDPLDYLITSDKLYDVILVDMPDPYSLGINRYYVKEFMRQVADHLKPGTGISGMTISGEDNYLSQPLIARNSSVYNTARAVFSQVIVTPGSSGLIIAGNPETGTARNDKQLFTLNTEVLAARYTKRNLNCPEYLAILYTGIFQIEQVALVNMSLIKWPDVIDSDEELLIITDPDIYVRDLTYAPLNNVNTDLINTNMNPAGYWLTRIYNTHKYDSEMLSFIRKLPVITYGLITGFAGIGILAIIILWISAFIKYPKIEDNRSYTSVYPSSQLHIRFTLIISMTGFGFASMALQVLVLLWYQSQIGQVYMGLALLTATFMAGLCAGTMLGNVLYRYRKYSILIHVLMLICTISLFYFVSGVFISHLYIKICALTLSGVAGFLLGIHYDLCSRLWGGASHQNSDNNNKQSRDNSAGWLYAADLLGAGFAALATAAIVVPVYGYAAGIMWIGIFTLIAGLGMLSVNLQMGKERVN